MIRVKTLDIAAGQRAQFTALTRDASRLEVEDAFFNTASALVLPEVPGASGSGNPQFSPFSNAELFVELHQTHPQFTFELVTVPFEPEDPGDEPERAPGLHVIIAALRFLERNPSHSLLIAGHTDRAGDDHFNKRLSGGRGKSVLALLEGKKSDFVAACREFHAPDDDPAVLRFAARTRGFDCQPSSDDRATPDEIRGFQRSFNTAFDATIPVDGIVGDATRGAYFELYEDELAKAAGGKEALARLRGHLRFVDPAHKILALGERFPRDNPEQDGLRSQANRRVEVLFFAPPRLPVPSAADAGEQIFRRKLFTFAALDRDALVADAVPVGAPPPPMRIVAAAPPEAGVGDASEPVVTTMPNAGRRNPKDAWAFLEPFVTHHPFEGDRPRRPNQVRPRTPIPPQPPQPPSV